MTLNAIKEEEQNLKLVMLLQVCEKFRFYLINQISCAINSTVENGAQYH